MTGSDTTWLIGFCAGSLFILAAVVVRLCVIVGYDYRAFHYNREADPATPPRREVAMAQSVRLGFTPAGVWAFYWLIIVSAVALAASAGSWLFAGTDQAGALGVLRQVGPLTALAATVAAGVLYGVALEWRRSSLRSPHRITLADRLLFALWALPLLLAFLSLLVAAFALYVFLTLKIAGADAGFQSAFAFSAMELLDIVPLGLGDFLRQQTIHTPAMDEGNFQLVLVVYKIAIVAIAASIVSRIVNIFFGARLIPTA